MDKQFSFKAAEILTFGGRVKVKRRLLKWMKACKEERNNEELETSDS